jgi:hypothetical protein
MDTVDSQILDGGPPQKLINPRLSNEFACQMYDGTFCLFYDQELRGWFSIQLLFM